MKSGLAVKGGGKGPHLHVVPTPSGQQGQKPKFPDLTGNVLAHAKGLGMPQGGPKWPDKYLDSKDAIAAVNVLLCMGMHAELKQMIKQEWFYTHYVEYGGFYPTVVQGTEQALMLAMKAFMKTDFEFVKGCLPHLILLHGKPDSEAWSSEPFSSEIKLVGAVIKHMLKEKYGKEWALHTASESIVKLLQSEHIDVKGCFTNNWLLLPPDALSITEHEMHEYLSKAVK